MNNEFVQHDTASKLQVTCFDETNTPIDLTNCSVELQYYIESNPPLYKKQMIIVDATNGLVEYQFDNPDDLADAGTLYFRVVITYQNGQVLTCPDFGEIVVRPVLE